MPVPERLCSRCSHPVPRGIEADFVEGKVVCGACSIHAAVAARGLIVGAYREPGGEWRCGGMPGPPDHLGQMTNLDTGQAMIIGMDYVPDALPWPTLWLEVLRIEMRVAP